jgi:endoglucanase
MIVALAAVSGLTVSGCGSGSAPVHSGSAAADAFLARYVTDDGRVLRHDQGDDIVSEGQAYGMLIAEIANRPDTVRRIWSWTDAHLRGSDGLLMSHMSGAGVVQDPHSAADADTLAAYALLRYTGRDEGNLHDAGHHLAAAVLAGESTSVGGSPVLVAGPWANEMSPPVVNPSYWMPGVFAALARLTGDERWRQTASTAVRLLADLTHNGRLLPPDWANIGAERLSAIPAPDGSAPIRYGLDAARLPIWFSTACTDNARRLAARWWTNVLSTDNRAADLALSPAGAHLNEQTNPLPLLAGAAAANAAGDTAATRALHRRAVAQSHQTPTYYGDAWLALAGALLDQTLDPCRDAADA